MSTPLLFNNQESLRLTGNRGTFKLGGVGIIEHFTEKGATYSWGGEGIGKSRNFSFCFFVDEGGRGAGSNDFCMENVFAALSTLQ